jgi:hypothetical protein
MYNFRAGSQILPVKRGKKNFGTDFLRMKKAQAGGGLAKVDEEEDDTGGLAAARKAAFSWIAPVVAVPKGKAALNQELGDVELGDVIYLADTDELVKSAKALEQEGTLANLLPRDLAKAVPTNNQKVDRSCPSTQMKPDTLRPSPLTPHPLPSIPIAKPCPPNPCPRSHAPNPTTSTVTPHP